MKNLENIKTYEILMQKITQILEKKIKVNKEIMEEIKNMIDDIPKNKAKEPAYFAGLISAMYNIGDFWHFANLIKNTIWFSKLMGIAAVFSYRRGEKFEELISIGVENTENLAPGLKALGYILLADSLIYIDESYTYDLIQKTMDNIGQAYDSIISGVVSTLSHLCSKITKPCLEQIEIAIDNLVSRIGLSSFEKVDILTYISEFMLEKNMEYSEDLIERAIKFYERILNPELKALALTMIQKAFIELGKKNIKALTKFENYENSEIKQSIEKVKKVLQGRDRI